MIRRRDMLVLGGLGVGGLGLVGRLLWGARPAPLCEDALECQERRSQQDLPRSDDPIWPTLKKCRVSLDKQSGTYQLTPTPEVLAMVGKPLQVRVFFKLVDARPA